MEQDNKVKKNIKAKKSKPVNIVAIDLDQSELKEVKELKELKELKEVKEVKQVKELKEVKEIKELKEVKEVKPIESFINNIDLLYLTNQVQYAKTNKLENLLSNNSLLKEIFDNLEDNINLHKEQILKYNNSTLEKLLATNTTNTTNITNNNINEKYKMYYLLYVLNLILHLKEKKIKNTIKDELKDYSNSSYNDQTIGEFNITHETINCMCPNDTSKKISNLDLFVVRKSNKYNKKILPQKRE